MLDSRLVSVIMPAYNSEVFISEAIASVRSQIYSNWELLIIDDASTDATKEIILEFSQNDERIKILENASNRGTHYARNKGIVAAQGDLIAFLDADDLWKPEKLQKQVKFLREENATACFSSY
ncbi:MAG: glycosyltransferase, partial [Gramella sp.]|nr:glycosyltransferase [Christiangramia sp.]